MEIAQLLFDFFGFENISNTATFVDLIYLTFKIFSGLWITVFVIRSLFMAVTFPDRRLF